MLKDNRREHRAVYFNPRTREGCDVIFIMDLKDIQNISIHAPVKGATPADVFYIYVFFQFQSTHP